MKKALLIVTWLLMAGTAFAAAAPDSKRLALAKDYIADEQWARAIDELRIVAADRNDPNRDEALFWLAHSEYQVGDHAEAIQTISRLERLFAKSRWVRPARSLRVEIAQRLRRDDALWVFATPPQPPPAPPAPVFGVAPPAQPAPRGVTPHALPAVPAAPTPLPAPPGFPATPRPTEFPAAPVATTPMPTPFPPGSGRRPPALPPMATRPGALPIGMTLDGLLPAEPYAFDTDLRMQALVSLLDSHSDRVIPLLREIALDNKNPTEARRAVFALAQSPRSDARNTVVEAARRGPGAVRIAAIREMGRFQGSVFTTALVGIARSESDVAVRDTAIVTLGRSGARVQLRSLYSQLPSASRFAVLTGLFTAKDDDELIRIASTERDQRLRTRARQHLRLLATPKAVKFLAENP